MKPRSVACFSLLLVLFLFYGWGGTIHAQEPLVMVVRDTLVIRDTVVVYLPKELEKKERPRVKAWQPLVAAGTNLLFDGVMIPNLEAQFPIGYSRWSVLAEWWTPWFRWGGSGRHNRAFELLLGGGEVRYWFSKRSKQDHPDVLKGHFVGVYGAGGIYDFEWDKPKSQGYQGEYFSAGVTYGYSFALGQRWRLELSLSAGYVGGPQRLYEGQFNDEHLIWQRSRNLFYLGPTKAKASLSYLFGWKTRQKGGER